jgi:capsular exopolysaccharide synthesis family protein
MEPSQRDEILKLSQRVFLSGEPAREVVVSSVEPGSGSTWICSRLGEMLASQVSASVCLVDANLRAPSLHQEFGVAAGPGLAEALQAADPARKLVVGVNRSNLWLLRAGTELASAQNLIAPERMRWRLAELRKEFDYVIVDSAPLTAGEDCAMLGRSADGVLLVLKANSSKRDAARKAIQDLAIANVRVLGAVLNQRTFPIPEKIYRKL